MDRVCSMRRRVIDEEFVYMGMIKDGIADFIELGRTRHRVAVHWLPQPIRAVFARSRPIMFKRP